MTITCGLVVYVSGFMYNWYAMIYDICDFPHVYLLTKQNLS